MSVQAISWVLDHSHTRGTDRLVLISLANHAGRSPIDGAWESWPSIATITREAGLDRTRTVQESLARLEATGAITRQINGAPDTRIRPDRRPSLYRITTTPTPPTTTTAAEPEPAQLTADQRRHRIRQAAELLAHTAAGRTPGITNPAAWTAAVTDRLERQHATAGHRLLAEHPDMPAQALADLLDDPTSPTAARHHQALTEAATRRHIRDTLARRADQPRTNPVPDIRALLHPQPTAPPQTEAPETEGDSNHDRCC